MLALLAAVQYLPVNTLCRIHPFCWINPGIVLVRLRFVLLKVGDVTRQCIWPVVNQVIGKLALLGINFRVGGYMRWVDDGEIKPGFDGMIQENAIEDGAGMRFQAKGDVAHTEDRQHAGEFCFDALDGF